MSRVAVLKTSMSVALQLKTDRVSKSPRLHRFSISAVVHIWEATGVTGPLCRSSSQAFRSVSRNIPSEIPQRFSVVNHEVPWERLGGSVWNRNTNPATWDRDRFWVAILPDKKSHCPLPWCISSGVISPSCLKTNIISYFGFLPFSFELVSTAPFVRTFHPFLGRSWKPVKEGTLLSAASKIWWWILGTGEEESYHIKWSCGQGLCSSVDRWRVRGTKLICVIAWMKDDLGKLFRAMKNFDEHNKTFLARSSSFNGQWWRGSKPGFVFYSYTTMLFFNAAPYLIYVYSARWVETPPASCQ